MKDIRATFEFVQHSNGSDIPWSGPSPHGKQEIWEYQSHLLDFEKKLSIILKYKYLTK